MFDTVWSVRRQFAQSTDTISAQLTALPHSDILLKSRITSTNGTTCYPSSETMPRFIAFSRIHREDVTAHHRHTLGRTDPLVCRFLHYKSSP